MEQLDVNVIAQLITVAIIVLAAAWRFPSKDDIRRLDDRIDQTNKDMKDGFTALDAKFENRLAMQDAKIEEGFARQDAKIEAGFARQDAKFDERFARQDAKFDERFDKQEARIEDMRKESKADLQRLEDRLESANEYHARSVELLDAIRRELEERREAL